MNKEHGRGCDGEVEISQLHLGTEKVEALQTLDCKRAGDATRERRCGR